MQYSSDQIVAFWTRYVGSLSRGPVTLLHGDAHVGNTYVLPDGSVGFLDWQVVRRGCWSQDVGYFLVGALTQDDRREHERALLQIYADALEVPIATCPSPDALWLHYRASAAYGLAFWLSSLGNAGFTARAHAPAPAPRSAAA